MRFCTIIKVIWGSYVSFLYEHALRSWGNSYSLTIFNCPSPTPSLNEKPYEINHHDLSVTIYRNIIIFSGNMSLRFLYISKALINACDKPLTNSSFSFCIIARLYHSVYEPFKDETNAPTELSFLFESWYVSMPQIITFLNGILMLHNDPPILQFICRAILAIIDRLLLSSLNVRLLIT